MRALAAVGRKLETPTVFEKDLSILRRALARAPYRSGSILRAFSMTLASFTSSWNVSYGEQYLVQRTCHICGWKKLANRNPVVEESMSLFLSRFLVSEAKRRAASRSISARLRR